MKTQHHGKYGNCESYKHEEEFAKEEEKYS